MNSRQYNAVDRLLMGLDEGLRTVGARPPASRASPADDLEDGEMTRSEREWCARLMRVDHAGEVSAQALYQGQALTARTDALREKLEQAADEELDHLAWCRERLEELDARASLLNPLWYAGSFAFGALAGVAGDRWSLGFLAETERQVVDHLDGHLQEMPRADRRSRAILERMRAEEEQHATGAHRHGGYPLPGPVRTLMRGISRVMTRTALWI